MNFQKVQKNYAQILVQLKESLIVWKKNILETLSKKNYHHKIRIYLISEKYLEDYEKYIINTLDINNLVKINTIFAETYNLYSQLFNSNFNNKTTLPKIFPLNEINYKFFKELAINKDNNNIQVINHFIGEFKELFFQITLANGFYLFYFDYNGNLRQGFLKINDINIMYEFEQNGPVFFAKNKTGKLLDDNEIFYFENNFQLYILRKTEINIEKTKKELEKINQRKLSNSSKLVNNQLIQSTFINSVNPKKSDKITNIFNSNNKKKLLKKCTIGKENLHFDDENEDENQVKLSVIKIKSNYLTDGSVSKINDIDININELERQLKEEKEKNKNLIIENKNLKEKIITLNKENDQIKELEKTINKLNIELDKIKELKQKLENDLTQKDKEIQKLLSQIKNKKDYYDISSLKPDDKIIGVNFVSMGSNDIGHYNLVGKSRDLFVRLEERLYEDFPQFKNYETYFEVNGKRIKRFQTLEQNKIKNNDIINIFIIEE